MEDGISKVTLISTYQEFVIQFSIYKLQTCHLPVKSENRASVLDQMY